MPDQRMMRIEWLMLDKSCDQQGHGSIAQKVSYLAISFRFGPLIKTFIGRRALSLITKTNVGGEMQYVRAATAVEKKNRDNTEALC